MMKILENKMIRQVLGLSAGLYAVGARASLMKLAVGASLGLFLADRFGVPKGVERTKADPDKIAEAKATN